MRNASRHLDFANLFVHLLHRYSRGTNLILSGWIHCFISSHWPFRNWSVTQRRM